MEKVIITGATGMIGKGVLLECLDDPRIEEVLYIGRNTAGIQHPKMKEILHANFSDFTPLYDQLNGYNACFFCLGISSAGMKEVDYSKITHDYTLALARVLFGINPEMTFCYVSGEGTDSTAKGRIMWARVKGKTENDLLQLGFRRAYMFRPGLIIPLRGIVSRTRLYRFLYDYFMWLVKFIKLVSPNSVVSTTDIGKAMINSHMRGYSTQILRPYDILQLASPV